MEKYLPRKYLEGYLAKLRNFEVKIVILSSSLKADERRSFPTLLFLLIGGGIFFQISSKLDMMFSK